MKAARALKISMQVPCCMLLYIYISLFVHKQYTQEKEEYNIDNNEEYIYTVLILRTNMKYITTLWN